MHKFLETGERGALITNVEYRAKKSPQEPAFDYLTWPQANQTFDRILQQSLAYYDPGKQVLVFVFLLSRSGNSVRCFANYHYMQSTYLIKVAIWRRKLAIPEVLTSQHGAAIQARKDEIEQRDLVIRVESVFPFTLRPHLFV